MNNYVKLSHLKRHLHMVTANDLDLVDTIAEVSRDIDSLLDGRHFYARTATRYFDGNGTGQIYVGDLISVTSLKVDEDVDQTYGTTLVVNDDYWLWPDNVLPNTPYRRIDLNMSDGQVASWTRGRRTIQVSGIWGYSAETETVTTPSAGSAVLINKVGGYLSTDTSLVVDADHGIDVGDMLVIGTEQISVTGISSANANSLLVARGQNGTTAAAIVDDAPINRRRYPRNLEAKALAMTNHRLWGGQQSYMAALEVTGAPDSGRIGSGNRELWGLIRDLQRTYMEPGSVLAAS
jgi:hypothetical protein